MAPGGVEASKSSATLLHLLSNAVIFDQLSCYLGLQTWMRLSRTAKAYRDFVFQTPRLFRHVDLTRCRGAYIPVLGPIDNGGHSWRAERIDENLTEDEFYAGPLRGVLSKLKRKHLLKDVQVLVLDEMASVTSDIVSDITTGADYSVRLLSVRKCVNLNEAKLAQLMMYLCRSGRPEGMPKLQGLYFFTNPADEQTRKKNPAIASGVTISDGAILGALPNDKSRLDLVKADSWYAPNGILIEPGIPTRARWESVLQSCKGIIAFDAVLCKHMHQALAHCLHDASRETLDSLFAGVSPIATVALGPDGCTGCGRSPPGAPIWGESDISEFPLLAPPPMSGRLVDAVRPPSRRKPHPSGVHLEREPQRLIVSCTWCLTNRHCDSCQRWWCDECYNPKKTSRLSQLEALSGAGVSTSSPSAVTPSYNHRSNSRSRITGDSVKIFNGLCVEHCLVGEMMSGAGSFGMWA